MSKFRDDLSLLIPHGLKCRAAAANQNEPQANFNNGSPHHLAVRAANCLRINEPDAMSTFTAIYRVYIRPLLGGVIAFMANCIKVTNVLEAELEAQCKTEAGGPLVET